MQLPKPLHSGDRANPVISSSSYRRLWTFQTFLSVAGIAHPILSILLFDFEMGNGQPYMYNPPARYSAIDPYNGFNPKSVTLASNTPPPPPKPKPEGPLLNFNRHPDSHLILPGRQSEPAPMNPNIKSRINWTRHTQVGLRAIQLLGAIGILVCVIFIRGTTDTQSLVIRIPVSQIHVPQA